MIVEIRLRCEKSEIQNMASTVIADLEPHLKHLKTSRPYKLRDNNQESHIYLTFEKKSEARQ